MTKLDLTFDPKRIEAEENLLIDCQFLLQELLSEKRMSRSELAEKAGMSKPRLSQIMTPEANPTVKTMARLFFALDEEIDVSIKRKTPGTKACACLQPFNWRELQAPTEKCDDAAFVALLKEASAKNSGPSNDNRSSVVVMELDVMLVLEAEGEPEPPAEAA